MPGVADDVLLGAFDTTFRSGTVGIHSFTGSGLLSVTGGQLTVSSASTIGALAMSNGSLGGSGNLTVSGAANLNFGDMRGTGTTFCKGRPRSPAAAFAWMADAFCATSPA